MVLVDNISDLEYYNQNGWPCYADIVTSPHDILLQALIQTGTTGFAAAITMTIKVLKPDGTFLEDATAYFDIVSFDNAIGTTNYQYANIRCNRYSPAMVANVCFILEITNPVYPTGTYHKYTQKYQLINSLIYPALIDITQEGSGFNVASLCSDENTNGSCNPLIKILAQFDCLDAYTGDYYGNSTAWLGTAGVTEFFPFVRFSWLQGYVNKLPTAVKRTVSVNCRTQRTERTNKYLLSSFVSFPLWKMEEIEGMMLANHLFVGDKEYQSEGGTPFEQAGKPINCHYAYKLGMELQDCFQWQTFGCTPPCTPAISFYPIAF